MQNRTYAQLIDTIEALAGVDSFDPSSEVGKILSFVNRRASSAYLTSTVWPRFIVVGEERTVDSGQIIPYVEAGKDNVGDFNRIHQTKPFLNDTAVEYDFYVDVDGAYVMDLISGATSAWVTYKKEFTDYTTSSVDIPFEWFEYLSHGCYADFLRMDGQIEAATVEDAAAEKYLLLELSKIDTRAAANGVKKRLIRSKRLPA
jgi:hypothetical protein